LGVIQNDLKVQDKVKVFIDDNKVITGYIEDLAISYTAGSHSREVSGRDKTGDLIDSSIIQKNYKQRNFIKMAEAVLKDNGYSDIKVINNIKKLPILTVAASQDSSNFEDDEQPTTENGDSIASYLDRYAKKIQALLITDEDGNINVTNEGDQLAVGALISGGGQSNILSANISVSTTERYRFMEIYSQSSNDEFEVSTTPQNAVAIDSIIRSPRRKRMTMSTASKVISLTNLAKWNVNVRKAKGSRYNCRVQGFYTSRDKGLLWIPNTLVQLRDDKCQVSGQFLIQGVTYTKNESGSFTDLSIVEKGAFSVEGVKFADGSSFATNLIRPA
jgi:prophage tail gpP-like protein